MKYALLITMPMAGFISHASEFSRSATVTTSKSPAIIEDLRQLVQFPKKARDGITVVTCSATATRRGNLRYVRCIAPKGSRKFISAVLEATKRTVVTPAIVADKPVAVRLQFTVTFERSSSADTISHLPNNGYDIERYGTKYVSAQAYRYLGPKVLLNRRPRQYRCPSDYELWISVEVSAEGVPSKPAVEKGFAHDNCIKSIFERTLNTRYIPAFASGEAVGSRTVRQWIGYEYISEYL